MPAIFLAFTDTDSPDAYGPYPSKDDAAAAHRHTYGFPVELQRPQPDDDGAVAADSYVTVEYTDAPSEPPTVSVDADVDLPDSSVEPDDARTNGERAADALRDLLGPAAATTDGQIRFTVTVTSA